MDATAWGLIGGIVGVLFGAGAAFAVLRRRVDENVADAEQRLADSVAERDGLAKENGRLSQELAAASARHDEARRREVELSARIVSREDECRGEREKFLASERTLSALREQQKALEASFAERERAISESRTSLLETIGDLSAKALHSNNEQFLKLAQQSFETLHAKSRGDQEQTKQAIDALVKPIQERLLETRKVIDELERKREGAYMKVETLVENVVQQARQLGEQTGKLVSALRRPEQRGRWGEIQLRNVVELAGMSSHCDFTEQAQTDDPEGRKRPDLIVNLPGGGTIVVDSKVSLDAYLDASMGDDAIDPQRREERFERHLRQVRVHVEQLTHKQYWKQFERTPQLVVMFMPIESALSAALDRAPDLHAKAMEQHVLIATPTLLVALLRAVAYGWRQEDVAANAREIQKAGMELYERLAKVVETISKVGRGLRASVDAYDDAVGSIERRLLPSARKLKELNVTTADDIESPLVIDQVPRAFNAPELVDGSGTA